MSALSQLLDAATANLDPDIAAIVHDCASECAREKLAAGWRPGLGDVYDLTGPDAEFLWCELGYPPSQAERVAFETCVRLRIGAAVDDSE